jgi:hypothetical protein
MPGDDKTGIRGCGACDRRISGAADVVGDGKVESQRVTTIRGM